MNTHTLTRRLVTLGLVFLLAVPALAADTSLVASGTFSGLSDHVTTGGVAILATASGYLVVLEKDFSLDGAPDPKLGFGKDGKFVAGTLFSPLRENNGAQIYVLPADVDPSTFDQIYVWCEKFSVPLGVASLR